MKAQMDLDMPEYFPNEAKLSTDTVYEAVDFMETYTGRAFYPRAPKVADVSVMDIAHHLSNQTRYAGATEWFYSTAQHCCLLADYVEKVRKGTPADCLQILLHDAAEAYLPDMPRPVKQYMTEFRKWDHAITRIIREWYNMGHLPIPPWQDEVDSRIIMDERAQLLSDSGLEWKHNLEPLRVAIDPWSAKVAEQQFLYRYATYSLQVFGAHQYLRSGWGFDTKSIYVPNFRTGGSDVAQKGEHDKMQIVDLMEVDLRGGVGRVALRSPDGMMLRDTNAGSFPRPAWKFIHGQFNLVMAGVK